MKLHYRKILILLLILTALPLWANRAKCVPRQRYRAEFEARATANVFPEDFRAQGVKLDYPGVELQFTDKKNRKYKRLARGSFFNLHSSDFVKGAIEFYAGEGIKMVRLVPRNAEIRNFRLVPVKNKSNLAIPLDHRISGNIRDYCFTPGKVDQAVYDIMFGKIYGDVIPIQGGKRFRLTVNGYGGERQVVVGLEFFTHDRGGKKASVRSSRSTIRIRGKRQQAVFTFIAPEKARWMRVTMMWGYVKNYKLEAIQ